MAREYDYYNPPGVYGQGHEVPGPITLQRSPVAIADVVGLTSRLLAFDQMNTARSRSIQDLQEDVRGLKICVFVLLVLVGFLGITMFLLWAG